jgi:hypothetical protein
MDNHPDYKDKKCMGVNPCITGDAEIMTNYGLRKVKDLIGQWFVASVYGKTWSSDFRGFWKTKKDCMN